MSEDKRDNKSKLIQAIVWCSRAPSYYMSQIYDAIWRQLAPMTETIQRINLIDFNAL